MDMKKRIEGVLANAFKKPANRMYLVSGEILEALGLPRTEVNGGELCKKCIEYLEPKKKAKKSVKKEEKPTE